VSQFAASRSFTLGSKLSIFYVDQMLAPHGKQSDELTSLSRKLRAVLQRCENESLCRFGHRTKRSDDAASNGIR
jgi:hypothetical protein